MSNHDHEKRAAAVQAALEIREGDRVGLGTGTTVAFFLRALAERNLQGLRCIATSVATERLANELGLPLEVMAFGLAATLRRLSALGPVERRDAPPTPDGGVIVDYLGPVADPAALAAVLAATPGVVGHGLFSPDLVTEVLIGRSGDVVEKLARERPA